MKTLIIGLFALCATSAFAGNYERDIKLVMDCGIVTGMTVATAVVSQTAQAYVGSDDPVALKATWEARSAAGSAMAEKLRLPKKLGSFNNRQIGVLLLSIAALFDSYGSPSAVTATEWRTALSRQASDFRSGLKIMKALVGDVCKVPGTIPAL